MQVGSQKSPEISPFKETTPKDMSCLLKRVQNWSNLHKLGLHNLISSRWIFFKNPLFSNRRKWPHWPHQFFIKSFIKSRSQLAGSRDFAYEDDKVGRRHSGESHYPNFSIWRQLFNEKEEVMGKILFKLILWRNIWIREF